MREFFTINIIKPKNKENNFKFKFKLSKVSG